MSNEENLISQEDLVKRYLQEKLGEKLSVIEKENESQHENLKKFLSQIEELKKVADAIESRLAKAKENEIPPLKITPPPINGEAKEPTPKGSDLTSPKNQDKKPKTTETNTQPKGEDKKPQPKENGISNKPNTSSSPKKPEEKKPVEPKKKEEPKEEEKKDKKPKVTPAEPKQPVKPVKDTKKEDGAKDKDGKDKDAAKENNKDTNKPAKADKEDKPKPADKKDNKPAPKKDDKKEEKPVENRASKVLEELTPEKALAAISKNDMNEIKGYITPSAQALATAKAFHFLLNDKESKDWAELKKVYKDEDLLAKAKKLSLDSVKNETLDTIEKWFKESNVTDESLKKSLGCQHVFRWIYSILNLRNPANKEVHEDKNKIAFVGAVLDAADKKIAQENKEEQKVEEAPQSDAQQAEAKEEDSAPPVEEKKVEKTEEPKVEEPVVEQPVVEEPKAQETKVEEPAVEDPAIEEPKAEEASGETESKPKVDIDPVVTELSDVLGHDVRSKVNESNWKEFIEAEYLSIEKQHSALLLANDELSKGGVSDSIEKKPYAIKESNKGFLQMADPEWIEGTFSKSEPEEAVYDLIYSFLVFAAENVPAHGNKAESWKAAHEFFNKHSEDLASYLISLESSVDSASLDKKVKLQKLFESNSKILDPETFSQIGDLPGCLCFLMKEIAEHLGLIPIANATKQFLKERIYLFNKELINSYNEKQNRLLKIKEKEL